MPEAIISWDNCICNPSETMRPMRTAGNLDSLRLRWGPIWLFGLKLMKKLTEWKGYDGKLGKMVPTGPLIFKDIRLTGFWMSRWYEDEKNVEERKHMYDELGAWIKAGEFRSPKFEKRSLQQYSEAIETAATKFDKKQLFIL
ncbi:hypothetical protein Y032_0460g1863 [Ancylostoma ceylanicum]|uniref:Alcohol dehydrogenase-like C-terminal domain-containing protein n=1 Tax=Ancylostoma ceylanicum TaxID=53326 RepID=A0A016WXE8_9BILA|nr:hypothetical protein Y032_0460g1863 [Ancylostoma ceylanicum]